MSSSESLSTTAPISAGTTICTSATYPSKKLCRSDRTFAQSCGELGAVEDGPKLGQEGQTRKECQLPRCGRVDQLTCPP
jgi:hypothetical protein